MSGAVRFPVGDFLAFERVFRIEVWLPWIGFVRPGDVIAVAADDGVTGLGTGPVAGPPGATGGRAGIDGITGASVGAGRTLEISLDLADALFDAGYTLHVDAAVEDMRDSPNEVAVPLTVASAKTPVRGRRYVSTVAYSF